MQNKKTDVGYIVKIAIIIFFLFIFGKVCPPWSTVTPMGVSVLGILIGVIFMLQVGFDLGSGAALGIFAFLLTGYYKAGDLLKAGMGSSSLFQLICLFALCGALEASGAAEIIAKKIVTSKIANGRPTVLVFLLLVAGAVGGATVGQSGALILMYSLADSIINFVDLEKEGKWAKTIALAELLATGLGSASFPFKGLGLTIFTLLNIGFADAGIEVEYGAYMLSSVVFSVLFIACLSAYTSIRCKAEMKSLASFDVKQLATGEMKLNKKQIVYTWTFVLILAYSFLTLLLPKTSAIYKTLNGWTLGFFCLLMIGILCLIKIDGKPLFNVAKDFKYGVRWNQVLGVFLFQTLGGSMNADTLGIKTWLVEALNPVFGDMSFLVFMIVIMLVTVVFTNFFANAAVGTIIATVIAPFIVAFSVNIGVNSSVVVAFVVQCACFAFWTPAASAIAPMMFDGRAMQNDRTFVWKDGMILNFIFAILSVAIFTVASYIL